MEKGIEGLEEENKNLSQRRVHLEDAIFKLRNDLKDFKKKQSKLQVEVNPLKEKAAMFKGQLENQRKKVKDVAPDKKKVLELF